MITRKFKNERMSQLVVHNNVAYSAGQVAEDTGVGIKGQTEQVLKSIESLLAEAGSDKSKILSIQIWLSDIKYFDEMNSVYDAWVDSDNPPTRACVESKLATPDYLVEIRFIAAVV